MELSSQKKYQEFFFCALKKIKEHFYFKFLAFLLLGICFSDDSLCCFEAESKPIHRNLLFGLSSSDSNKLFLNSADMQLSSMPSYLWNGMISTVQPEGIGYCYGYSSCRVLGSFSTSNGFALFDGRLHVFNDGQISANIGGGVRLPNNIGFNLFYDLRNDHNCFNQIGIGFEYLNKIDIRLNAYLPIHTQKKLTKKCVSIYEGGYFVKQYIYKFPLYGLDGELGLPFTLHFLQFYGAMGPYFLTNSQEKLGYGIKARISCFLTHFLSCEFIISHDSIFRSKYQGKLTFQIPFSSSGNRYDIIPIERRDIIPLNSCCCWDWNY